MSIRNIARRLQQMTGLPYMECINGIRSLGDEPSATANRYAWPLSRATIYLFDHDLDHEYATASRGARGVHASECRRCGVTFFIGLDKKGIAVTEERLCPECRHLDVHFCSRCGENVVDPHGSLCGECWDSLLAE